MTAEKDNRTILVTGATGKQGGAVARHLVGKGFNVQAMTRNLNSESARALSGLGIDLVQADLNDAGSLAKVLRGIWGVFAVQNTWEAGVDGEEEQGKRLAQLAREQGVEHFVYSSVGSAHRKTGIPHFDNKWRIEEVVRSLHFPSWAILRPVFFMENLISPWFMHGDRLVAAMKPETVLQMVAVEDIGKFGALLFEKSHELSGAEIDLAGDALTMPEAAAVIAGVLDRGIEFVRAPIEEVRKSNEDFAIMLEWFDRVGYNADITGMAKKYGIKLLKLAEWAQMQIPVA